MHGTTKQVPREHFEREERAVLQSLAERLYESLVLPEAAAKPVRMKLPVVAVERRPLRVYADLIAAGV